MAKIKRRGERTRKSERLSAIGSTGSSNSASSDSFTPARRDGLTGRGFVNIIDDFTSIEFETLNDMKLYDSIAEEMGHLCCSPFNEFSLPFRGFSEEECSNSSNHHLFKNLANVANIKSQGIEKSKSEPRDFKGFSESELNENLSCHLNGVVTRSQDSEIRELGFISSENYCNAINNNSAQCLETKFDINVDDSFLTTVGASGEKLHYSEKSPTMNDSFGKTLVDLSVIPFMFKCHTDDKYCTSSKCAKLSSIFTLHIRITSGKRRPMTKFAIMYLDQRRSSEFSNTIDEVAATIAATAVDSKCSTTFLPVNKKIISSLCPQLKILQQLESLLLAPSKSQNCLQTTKQSDSNADSQFELLQSNVGLMSSTADSLKVCAHELISINNSVSPSSSDKREMFCGKTNKRRSTSNITPVPYKKISLNCTDTKASIQNSMENCNMKSTVNCNPLPLQHSNFVQSDKKQFLSACKQSSTDVTNNSVSYPLIPTTVSACKQSSTDVTNNSVSYPLIPTSVSACKQSTDVTNNSVSYPLIPTTVSASSLNHSHEVKSSGEPQFKIIQGSVGKMCQPTKQNHIEEIVDLTESENEIPVVHGSIEHPVCSISSQSAEEVVVIDDDSEDCNTLNPETMRTGDLIFGSSNGRPIIVVSCDDQIVDFNEQMVDLTVDSVNTKTECKELENENVGITINTIDDFIDLTEEDEHTPTNTGVQEKHFVANADPIPLMNEMHDTTESDENLNCRDVIESRNKLFVGAQELAIMCKTAPTLGFIKILRCSTGRLLLNDTFTAGVYEDFEDLKPLNKYLNQRFEKMAGVKDFGPLEWNLATSGVINVKKIQPIDPKVWFHPNDYILKKDDSTGTLTVVPLDVSKTKFVSNKIPTSSASSKYEVPVLPNRKKVMLSRSLASDLVKNHKSDLRKDDITNMLPTGMDVPKSKPYSSQRTVLLHNKDQSVLNGSTQSKNIVSTTAVQTVTHGKSSAPPKYQLLIGNRKIQQSAGRTKINNISNSRSVLQLNNHQVSRANQVSTYSTFEREEKTSASTTLQNNPQSRGYWKTNNEYNGVHSSNPDYQSSDLRRQFNFVNQFIESRVHEGDVSQVGNNQNTRLLMNCRKTENSNMSASNTPGLKDSSYERTSNPQSLSNGKTICTVKTNQRIDSSNSTKIALTPYNKMEIANDTGALNGSSDGSVLETSVTKPTVIWVDKKSLKRGWKTILLRTGTPLIGNELCTPSTTNKQNYNPNLKTNLVSTSQMSPAKCTSLITSNAQNSALKKLNAANSSHTRQFRTRAGQEVEKKGFVKPVICLPSDIEKRGRVLPMVVSKSNDLSINSLNSTVAPSSNTISSQLNNKSVESVGKRVPPIKLYSTHKDKSSLKLHWSAQNIRKSS